MGGVNLTTGTFNLFVKDQNRGPPERRVFSRAIALEEDYLSSKLVLSFIVCCCDLRSLQLRETNFSNIPRAANRVNGSFPQLQKAGAISGGLLLNPFKS
jgi:hypothetical protein